MFVPKLHFGSIDEILEGALEEGNYVMGYKKFVIAAQLDEHLEKEGLELVRQATNPTKAMYRFREEIKALEAKKTNEARRQQKALVEDGTPEEPEKLVALDKEIRKVEHKIVAAAYDISLLREPLEDFLYDSEIPRRDKYNRGRSQFDE